MCASYGLGGGRRDDGPGTGMKFAPVAPLDEPVPAGVVAAWMREWGGKASTSRVRKDGRTNLNPVIWQDAGGMRRVDLGWWWLHVGGAPARFTAFNSRDDALLVKWREPFQHRAILPADWYSEGGKVWRLPGGESFGMAAILSPRIVGGATTISYSLVTRAGIGEAASVVTSRGDSRMPLVLPTGLHDEWLDPARRGDAALVAKVQAGSEEISRALTAR